MTTNLLRRRGVWLGDHMKPVASAVPATAALVPGGLDAPPTSDSDDEGRCARGYLRMHRSVIAATRGGAGLLAWCARFSVPVEAFFAATTAMLEAAGASRCERQVASATTSLVVSCVAFGYALIAAPHPSPVKAVLHAVSAAFCALVSLFVVLALGDIGPDAAAWTQRAQTTTLVASGIGVVSTVVSVATWWLRRRADRRASSASPATSVEMATPLLTDPSSSGSMKAAGASPLVNPLANVPSAPCR